MKILYLCSWYRCDPSGYEGVFFAEQAAVFAARGHEVALANCGFVSLLRKGGSQPFLVSREEALTDQIRASVYRSELTSFPPRIYRLQQKFNRWRFGHFLERVVADLGRPDVVHIQSALYAGLLGYRWFLRHRIPYLITEHASAFHRGDVQTWLRAGVRRCFQCAERVFSVSSFLADDLRKAGVDRSIEILPNIYNERLFGLRPTEKRPEFTFITVCALFEHKRVEDVMRALQIVRRSDKSVRLIVAGDGPERQRLMELAQSLNVDASVEFVGNQLREQVAQLLQQSHCLISASSFETFGITLIEALACGLPVIATRSGGPEDFVEPPDGTLVPDKDPQALAQAMAEAVRSRDDSEQARQRRNRYVHERFSADNFYSRLMPVYENLTSHPPSSSQLR